MKRLSVTILSIILTFVAPVVTYATTADYYDPGLCYDNTKGGYVNKCNDVIPNATKRGIDVSMYQHEIDWDQVATDDVSFAFIRCGSFSKGLDPCFHANMQGANRVGIPVGIYIFSDAITREDAIAEGEYIVNCASEYKVSYPLVIDIEGATHAGKTPEEFAAIIEGFTETVENAGYRAMVYSSRNWFNNKMFYDNCDKWVAAYREECGTEGASFWQASSHGKIKGIEGRVDIDFMLSDVPMNTIEVSSKTTSPYLKAGWLQEGDLTYYIDTATMQRTVGKFVVNGKTFFADSDGVVQSGMVKIQGVNYFFDYNTRVQLFDTEVIRDGKKFTIDKDGKTTMTWL